MSESRSAWKVPTWLFVPVSVVYFTAVMMGAKVVTNMLGGYPATSGILLAVYLGLAIGAVATGLGVRRRMG